MLRRTEGYLSFSVVKPSWWKRYVVLANMKSGLVFHFAKFWSRDKADNLAEKLNKSLD